MRYISALFILALAACGVDGEPERPDRAASATGVSITGTASIGVTGTH